ncbi:zincin-like metallopeptidase domain-containing protein, partial [Xylella fastidiosa]
MGVTVLQARALVVDFCRDYPVAAQLSYYIRETVEELYGKCPEGMERMLGAYVTGPGIHPGRCDIPCGNAKDTDSFISTLRHEVIGHFGLNTFTREDKKALLDGISAAREKPFMRSLWRIVEENYAHESESIKAEEVFALYCEGIEPELHVTRRYVHEQGEQVFRETCIDRTRLMNIIDLNSIALMVAQGLHDRTRLQRNFTELNQQFQREPYMEPKKPFHEVVAERLIEQLKVGTAPWQRPWEPGRGGLLPMNPSTGKRYKGINAIYLMSQQRTDPRWLTYKQAEALGAQVRRGEKSTSIQYWKYTEKQIKTDDQGRPVLDVKGQPVMEEVRLERPRVFFASVFNAEQIDGLPTLQHNEQTKEQTWDAVERAENILEASEAMIYHGEHNRAFYNPSTDSIHLADKSQFPSADNYYATLLHELGHWTGHSLRLDRDMLHPFGSEGYAKEELRAEIASMILGDELGIGHDPGQHAAYVGSWIRVLKDDSLEIFRAAADAEKIQEYLLAFEQKQVQEATNQQGIAQNPEPMMQQEQAVRLPSRMLADQKVATLLRIAREDPNDPFGLVYEGMLNIAFDEAFGPLVKGMEQVREVLPLDWNGRVRVESHDSEPNRFAVFVQRQNGEYQWLEICETSAAMDSLIDRLAVINAYAEIHEKQARYEEQNVQLPSITLADQKVATALRIARDLKNSFHQETLRVVSEEAFGPVVEGVRDVLPVDWNGRVRVEPSFVVNDRYLLAHVYGREPTHWRVFVQCQNGKYEWLETCGTSTAVESLVDRLVVIDAYTKENEHERLTAFARIHEKKAQHEKYILAAKPAVSDNTVQEQQQEQYVSLPSLAAISAYAKENEHEWVAAFVRTHEKQPRHDKDTLAAKTTVADNTVQEQQQQQDVALPSITVSEKIWLDLPYKQKEAAKHAAGNLADGNCAISWDKEEKRWYARPGADLEKIKQWLPSHEAKPTNLATKKTWLAVTFEQRHAVKEIGGKLPNGNNAVDWDNAAKCWYANPGADLDKLKPWIATEIMSRQVPALSPEKEFAET